MNASIAGSLAADNYFRFSTKYWDGDAKLSYYGFRYYSPGIGRWVSRDLLGEAGDNNIYEFILNSPILKYDLYGLLTHERPTHGLMLGFGGEFSYYTAWKLDKKYNVFGTITMQMRIQQEVYDMNGWIIEGGPKDIRYTEAWRVLPNSQRTIIYQLVPLEGGGFPEIGSFYADDKFSDKEHRRCTRGWSKFEGFAAYYKGIPIPGDWTRLPYAGILDAIEGWKDLGEETEGYDIKTITVKWDCIYGTCETMVEDIR